jgi:hypothetical protein
MSAPGHLKRVIHTCHYRREGSGTLIRFGRKMRPGTSGNKRKTERSRTFAASIVETPASRHNGTIFDISQYGARIIGDMPYSAGRELRIRVNEIDLFGIVAWRKDNQLGIQFEEILSDHKSSEICHAVLAAETYSRQFDREASLQALANRPGGASTVTALAEANGRSAPRLAS